MGALGLEGRICGELPPPTRRTPGKGRGAWGMNLAATWIPALLSIPPSCFGDETPAEQTALKEPPRPSRWSHLEAGGGQSPRVQGGPCPHPALDHPGGLPCPRPHRPEAPWNPSAPHGRLSQRPCWRHPLPSGHLLQERGSCSWAPRPARAHALTPGPPRRLAVCLRGPVHSRALAVPAPPDERSESCVTSGQRPRMSQTLPSALRPRPLG